MGSRRCWRRPRRSQLPRARSRDPEPSSTGAVGEPGWHVQEAVAQCLGLAVREDLGIAGQGEHPGPRGQVSSDLDQHQPDLVDVELSGWEAPESRVLGVPNAVLDPSMGTVPGLEERQLAGLRVGDERLVAPPVAFLEQRQLGAGVGSFAAHDDSHPLGPLGQVKQPCQLGDIAALTHAAVGIERRGPDLLRDQVDRVTDLLGDRESHAVLHAAAADLALLGEPVQQCVGRTRAVGPDQQLLAVSGGDLGDRVGEDLDVVSSGVRSRVARTELGGEELTGVVTPHAQRVESEGPLEGRCRVLLLAVADHDRGVGVQHDQIVEFGTGDPAGRHTIRELGPHVATRSCPRGLDLLQPCGRDLVQGTPHRRRRRDPAQHAGLVAQHVDVSDRLTTISEHHRNVGQDPAAVMKRDKVAADHHLGQLGREAGAVSQQTGGDAARVGHHADTITGHGQAGGPRSTLHLRSAFHVGDLESSQTQVSPAGQALPCFYAPITPEPRERSGLTAPSSEPT